MLQEVLEHQHAIEEILQDCIATCDRIIATREEMNLVGRRG